MPWWSWILLWVALVALSLLFVAWLALKVWRDASSTMRTASAMGERLSDRWDAGERAATEALAEEARVTQASRPAPGAAVFATPGQMKDDYLAAKEGRRFARLQRRVARRKERGQLQSLRDITTLEDVG